MFRQEKQWFEKMISVLFTIALGKKLFVGLRNEACSAD